MKAWAVAVVALSVGGAVVGAGLLAVRSQANAEASTNALVAAERLQARARTSASAPPVAAAVPAPPTVTAPVAAPSPPASVAPVAAAAPAPPPPASVAPAATPAADDVQFKKTATFNGAAVYVPQTCSGPYDVVLHFHGAHPYVRDLVEKAKLNAVVAVFNAGNGAEKYSQAFGAGGTLASLLRQVDMAAAPLCGANAKPRRVALMAWSAGYAAVEKLLSHDEDRQRVDAALLADGLHAGFADVWKRQFAPNALQAFRDFGALAKQGQKLFAITHSSIMTDGYASTTECSKLLLKALDIPCESTLISGKSGNFSIEGFTGNDKAAHIVQFRQMDKTLLAKLRERWLP